MIAPYVKIFGRIFYPFIKSSGKGLGKKKPRHNDRAIFFAADIS
jgi:hypothetical protein